MCVSLVTQESIASECWVGGEKRWWREGRGGEGMGQVTEIDSNNRDLSRVLWPVFRP